MDHFFLFYLPNNPENQNFEKKIDVYEDAIIIYICLPKITIIWCMLPEIWVQHTIFCNFGTFFALYPLLAPRIKTWKKIKRYFLFHMCTINKNSWDIRRNRQKILSFWAIFCHFIPLTNQKIKIFKKWK